MTGIHCLDDEVGVVVLKGYDCQLGSGQDASLAGQVAHRGRLVAALQEHLADLAGRLHPLPLTDRSLVEPSILDRDPRGRGQRDHDGLVLVGEARGADLLGEVEVAEDLMTDPHRGPHEAAHRGVVRREPVRRRVVGQGVQPQRSWVADQQAQYAMTPGKGADGVPLRGGQAVGDELDEVLAVRSEHPQGAVGRVDQVAGAGHDPGQDLWQVQPRGDGHDRVQECAEALLGLAGGLSATAELIQQVVQVERVRAWPTLILSSWTVRAFHPWILRRGRGQ